MKKKGYTLIELLAVIVILAIIALMVVPVIGDLIKNARLAAFRTSMYGIINSADAYINTYDITHDDELIYPYEFVCDGRACAINDDALEFKGKVPIGGKVVIKNGGTLIDYVTDGTFCAYGYKWNLEIVDECEDVPVDYAGLFDIDDNLVADWNTLVTKYNFNISKDYSGNFMYESQEDGDVLYYILENNPELSEGVKLVISNSVAYIGNNAVSRIEQLKTVIIPDSVRIIGEDAFEFDGIENLTLGNNIEEINNGAFYANRYLKVLDIPDSVKIIGANAFYDCGLVDLTIGSGVESIVGYTFGDCWDLTNLTIKNGNAIETYAFSYDENVEYLSISGTTVIDGRFYIGRNLKTLIIGDGAERIETSFGNENLVNVVLPDSITYIGSSVFEDSPNLTSITLPSNLENIGSSAFQNTGLTEVVIPNNVTTIADYAFSGCSDLENVILSNSVTTIGGSVFNGSGIKELILPDSVTTIGVWAFSDCSNLESVVIGDGITGDLDGYELFYGSNNIKSLVIGNGVTDFSLDDTRNLETLVVGNGVTEIISGINSPKLKSVTLGSSFNHIMYDTFGDASNLINLTFADTSKKWYYTNDDWEEIEFDVNSPSSNAAKLREVYSLEKDLYRRN